MLGIVVGLQVSAIGVLLLPVGLVVIEKRGAAIGLWGGIVGLGVAAGPIVGGSVVSGLDWHWMFWINVPVGMVLVPLAMRYLTESHGPRAKLDARGVLLAGSGLFGITWALVRANGSGWTSIEVSAAMVAGTILLAAFLSWERHSESPMLPLELFRSRTFAAANAVSFFMYAGLFGALFLMSQLLQTALGYSPIEAGLGLLPWTVPPMLIAPLAGTLADRYGNRPFMVLGLALQAAGYAWVASIVGPAVEYPELGAAFMVAGIGTSFCFATVANAVMASVPMERAGTEGAPGLPRAVVAEADAA